MKIERIRANASFWYVLLNKISKESEKKQTESAK